MRNPLASYLDEKRAWLRQSPAYRYYRRTAARRQRRELERLVHMAMNLATDEATHARSARELDGRKSSRKPLPETLGAANVVGVGAQGWERFGLWPSFGRSCDFHLFTDGLDVDVPFYCHSRTERDARIERLLGFIDGIERTAPVHACFIYADASNLSADLFRRLHDRGIWTILMGLDDRHTFAPFKRGDLEAGVATVSPLVDLYWTSWRTGVLVHRSVGGRAWFGGAAADPTFHRALPPTEETDVLFLGQAYGARREIIGELRDLGVNVTCRGHGWDGGFVSFEDYVRLYATAKIVLGISAVGAMDDVTILKGRDFEAPMCGTCYVTQYTEELSEFFDLGSEVGCYSTPLQAAELIVTLLNDPPRREAMRKRALAASLENNTWSVRLRQLYEVMRTPNLIGRASFRQSRGPYPTLPLDGRS